MNTNNTFAETTIVAFHIGRGGRFYNAGHLSFIGENTIDKYVDDLFLCFQNQSDIWNEIKGRENLEEKYHAALDGNEDALAFFANRLNMPFGEKEYFDGGGNPVGLTEKEAETGIGTINIDNDYDTTYTCYLKDIDENEAQAILSYNGYVDSQIVEYAKSILEIEDENEE